MTVYSYYIYVIINKTLLFVQIMYCKFKNPDLDSPYFQPHNLHLYLILSELELMRLS